MEKKRFVEPTAEVVRFGGKNIVTSGNTCTCYRDATNNDMDTMGSGCSAIVDTNYSGNTYSGNPF